MASKEKTVTVEDAYGNKVETPVGVDGKNPVSPDNPPAKALTEEDAKEIREALKQREADEKAAAEAAAKNAK